MSAVPRRSRRPRRPSRPVGAAGPDRTRTLDPSAPQPEDSRGPFAETWWGGAWVEALQSAALDPARLARGRTYARQGHVDRITVTPGRITAPVHGSRPRPYLSTVRLQVFTDEQWDVFLDAVAQRPAHIAALLDKDMPHALAEDAGSVGVPLFPQHREIDSDCSCPDDGSPCKHVAALCYRTARFLDADPFVLLLMRGRGEHELLDELGRRNVAKAARGAGEARTATSRGVHGVDHDGGGDTGGDGAGPDIAGSAPAGPAGAALPTSTDSADTGTLARAALATGVRPPLPPPLPLPGAPGRAPLLPELPGAPDAEGLAFLVTDAAHRAYDFLTGNATGSTTATGSGPATAAESPERVTDPFARGSAWHDAVRLAATHPELGARRTFSPLVAQLAQATGHTAVDLARAGAAWRQGGRTGLGVLESEWDPPAGGFDRARSTLMAAGLPRMTICRNRLTDQYGARQLRYGQDGRWYPYRSEAGAADWWPEGPAHPDPATALRGSLRE